jgi:hypothetical protein
MAQSTAFKQATGHFAATATKPNLLRKAWSGRQEDLVAYKAARDAVAPCEVVELPESGTLNDLWDALGYPDLGGQTTPQGGRWTPGTRLIEGVYRRLEAALSSIQHRGTAAYELELADDGEFKWESEGGRWSRRHWRVTGRLQLVDGRLEIKESVVAVESTVAKEKEDRSEWTAFFGGPLDAVLADRLIWVVAQFGARLLLDRDETVALEGWESIPLNEVERGMYMRDHTSPRAAWETPHGRVVLHDDPDGSARLTGECRGWGMESDPVPDGTKEELIALFLSDVPRVSVDTSLPSSDKV